MMTNNPAFSRPTRCAELLRAISRDQRFPLHHRGGLLFRSCTITCCRGSYYSRFCNYVLIIYLLVAFYRCCPINWLPRVICYQFFNHVLIFYLLVAFFTSTFFRTLRRAFSNCGVVIGNQPTNLHPLPGLVVVVLDISFYLYDPLILAVQAIERDILVVCKIRPC